MLLQAAQYKDYKINLDGDIHDNNLFAGNSRSRPLSRRSIMIRNILIITSFYVSFRKGTSFSFTENYLILFIVLLLEGFFFRSESLLSRFKRERVVFCI